MANNYTQFSVALACGSPENAAKALAIFVAHNDKADEADDGDARWNFDASLMEDAAGSLWINSGDEWGSPDNVLEFAAEIGKSLKLKGRWGFTWACTCSKLRLDEFDGGAAVISFPTGKVAYVNSTEWLQKALKPRRAK